MRLVKVEMSSEDRRKHFQSHYGSPDGIVFGLGINLLYQFSPFTFMRDAYEYLCSGRVRYTRHVDGKELLYYTTHMGTGANWSFHDGLSLDSVRCAVGLGWFGLLLPEEAGDVFIPSSAVLLPTIERRKGTEIEVSSNLREALMESAERSGLKPYTGKVCTVHDPFHGKEDIVLDLGCIGCEQETWYLLYYSKRLGKEAASALIASDIQSFESGYNVLTQASKRRKRINFLSRTLANEVIPHALSNCVQQ